MVDIVEAEKNLETLKQNRKCLENYNHLFSSFAFKEFCYAELLKTNKQIYSIETQLNAESKKTRQYS